MSDDDPAVAQASSDADPELGEPPLVASFRPGSVGLVATGALLLAVVMSWPLVLQLGEVIPHDALDPLLQAWQVAWVGDALLHQPLGFFDSNAFWPLENSLAFTDVLIGYAPAGAIGSGPDAALVRYNLLFLFAYALPFFGGSLLARGLGLSWIPSLVAGAAYAYAPWRLAQNNHLHVLSSGAIPLALLLLFRGYTSRRPRMVVAGWLVATWQVSLGFTLGLQLAYLLAVLGALVVVRWLWRRSPPLQKGLLWASGAGIGVFLVWSAIQAAPYLQVREEYPESLRPPEHVAFFSPPPRGLLVAPEGNWLWGDRTKATRDTLSWHTEQALFPGLTLIALAVAGLFVPVLSRAMRAGLAAGALITGVLCLGYGLAGGRYTYRFLYDYAPGWSGSRTPGRIFTLTSLALALLAAAGAQGVVAGLARKSGAPWGRSLPVAVASLFVLAILAEGAGPLPLAPISFPPQGQRGAAEPQLHLPTDEVNDATYMFWSTDGFPLMVNGYGGFTPARLQRLRDQVTPFPDQVSVDVLRDLGVRTVIFHPERAPGTAWADAATRPTEGLGLSREEAGGLILLHLHGDP